MVEFRPAGLGWLVWVGFGVFVPFSTICLFFPSFNDDLGTMPHTASALVEKTLLRESCQAPDGAPESNEHHRHLLTSGHSFSCFRNCVKRL